MQLLCDFSAVSKDLTRPPKSQITKTFQQKFPTMHKSQSDNVLLLKGSLIYHPVFLT